ncbi:MAG TPA: hypothetical protein VGN42_06860 [Pirellulales bacterium]|jgi:hypothetical protein|nr:hypothetical protein [Pirellulales bacterium]
MRLALVRASAPTLNSLVLTVSSWRSAISGVAEFASRNRTHKAYANTWHCSVNALAKKRESAARLLMQFRMGLHVIQQQFRAAFQHGVGRVSDHVFQAVFFEEFVQFGNAVTRISADHDFNARPSGAQDRHDPLQGLDGAPTGMGLSGPKPRSERKPAFAVEREQRKILLLVEITVPKRQLLLAAWHSCSIVRSLMGDCRCRRV